MKREKEKVKDYIHETWAEITSICAPLLRFYQIRYSEEKCNLDGGSVGVVYEPQNLSAEVYIYTDIFEEMPSGGLTEGFKNWIKRNLCHEAGHVYLWEFEGTEKNTERMATMIGLLIMEILDSRLEKKKKKGRGK